MTSDFVYLVQNVTSNNSSIIIRNLTIADINQTYCNWLNEPDVNKYLESRFINWDLPSLRKYFHEKNKTELMLAIVDSEHNLHIGNIKISSIEKIHKRAELGIIIGDRNYWGKGIATTAIKMVTDYCFTILELHKVTAGAYAENISSIKAFQKNGFTIEGERKDRCLTPSGWTSVILMGKINKNIC